MTRNVRRKKQHFLKKEETDLNPNEKLNVIKKKNIEGPVFSKEDKGNVILLIRQKQENMRRNELNYSLMSTMQEWVGAGKFRDQIWGMALL